MPHSAAMSSPCASSTCSRRYVLQLLRQRAAACRSAASGDGGTSREQDEVVIGDVRNHHDVLRRRVFARVELTKRIGRVFQHIVQLLPAVDLLDLLVPDEMDVQHGEFAAAVEQLARPFDHDGQCGEAGQPVVQQLLVAEQLGGFLTACAARRDRLPAAARPRCGLQALPRHRQVAAAIRRHCARAHGAAAAAG